MGCGYGLRTIMRRDQSCEAAIMKPTPWSWDHWTRAIQSWDHDASTMSLAPWDWDHEIWPWGQDCVLATTMGMDPWG